MVLSYLFVVLDVTICFFVSNEMPTLLSNYRFVAFQDFLFNVFGVNCKSFSFSLFFINLFTSRLWGWVEWRMHRHAEHHRFYEKNQFFHNVLQPNGELTEFPWNTFNLKSTYHFKDYSIIYFIYIIIIYYSSIRSNLYKSFNIIIAQFL